MNNGITLIALVITIIILLILAGVSIGMATSGTGLFEKAKEATEKYQNAQDYEETEIAKYSNEIDTYVNNLSISTPRSETSTNYVKDTIKWEENKNSIEFDFGYIPTFLFIKTVGGLTSQFSDDGCNTFYYAGVGDANQAAATAWTKNGTKITFTPSGGLSAWQGKTINVFAIK